jgi:flagellar biosynthesis/type III secretory pathway chaperone
MDKKINSIDDFAKKQDELITTIKKLEEEKTEVFNLMIEEMGLEKNAQIKLTDLLSKMDENDSKDIQNAVIDLISVVKEVQAVNSQNAGLIKNYIEYVDAIRKIKEKIENPQKPIYTSTGNKHNLNINEKPKIDKKF